MNTTMESAADAAALTTKKTAAKIAAKQQVAAEQAEAKRKTKVEKARATKEVAEDAAPAPKEEAPVIIWPGLISDSGRPGLCLEGSGRTTGTPDVPCGLCGLSRREPVCSSGTCRAFRRNASADHASSPCNAHPLNFLI